MPNVSFKPAVENRCRRFLLLLKFETGRLPLPLPFAFDPFAFDPLLDLLDFLEFFDDLELLLPLDVGPWGVVYFHGNLVVGIHIIYAYVPFTTNIYTNIYMIDMYDMPSFEREPEIRSRFEFPVVSA